MGDHRVSVVALPLADAGGRAEADATAALLALALFLQQVFEGAQQNHGDVGAVDAEGLPSVFLAKLEHVAVEHL